MYCLAPYKVSINTVPLGPRVSFPDPEAFSDFLGCLHGKAKQKSFITKAALTSLLYLLQCLDWL